MLVRGDKLLGENASEEERIRFISTGTYRIAVFFDGLLRSCNIWRGGLMEIFWCHMGPNKMSSCISTFGLKKNLKLYLFLLFFKKYCLFLYRVLQLCIHLCRGQRLMSDESLFSHAYMPVCVCLCRHMCTCACVCVSMCACVSVCMFVWVSEAGGRGWCWIWLLLNLELTDELDCLYVQHLGPSCLHFCCWNYRHVAPAHFSIGVTQVLLTTELMKLWLQP